MGLYEAPLSMSLLGFGMVTILANFHMCDIMLVLSIFNILVRNASPRGPMCFKSLMFSLSGPCELLYPCILCVTLLWICLSWCCVFDNMCELFGETIRNMFGCGCYFVVECYGSV